MEPCQRDPADSTEPFRVVPGSVQPTLVTRKMFLKGWPGGRRRIDDRHGRGSLEAIVVGEIAPHSPVRARRHAATENNG
jgi:hypothetical protein